MNARNRCAPDVLNPSSLVFAALRGRVLAAWIRRVVAEVPVAGQLEEAILVSNLPILYNDIAEALTPGFPRAYATAGSTLAYSHGRDRANLTEYGSGDVVHELQLFRSVILEIAEACDANLGRKHKAIIAMSIDNTIREAVTAFTRTNQEIGQVFIASLAHDLRNPLGVISVYAQLIVRRTEDKHVYKLASKMCLQIKEFDVMLQTLLDAAVFASHKKLNLNITEFDLRALVDETCADVHPDENPYVVAGDNIVGFWCRISMKRALQNLLSNAQKYGERHSDITVQVKRIDHRVFLSVHNAGPAIPPKDVERMFAAFERLGGVHVQGWGLGLPFVRNVAESHRGTVFVDSDPERGTTFTISVPLDCRESAPVTNSGHAAGTNLGA